MGWRGLENFDFPNAKRVLGKSPYPAIVEHRLSHDLFFIIVHTMLHGASSSIFSSGRTAVLTRTRFSGS